MLEVTDDFLGDTYRAVYTVQFAEAVYVLHAFQKKSRRGRATPPEELATIRRRLAWAQAEHDAWLEEQRRR